jgi:hypothetical protein
MRSWFPVETHLLEVLSDWAAAVARSAASSVGSWMSVCRGKSCCLYNVLSHAGNLHLP